jgi:hypothetical protein
MRHVPSEGVEKRTVSRKADQDEAIHMGAYTIWATEAAHVTPHLRGCMYLGQKDGDPDGVS